jgi:tRNA threonylcarbamoyladenosine biosynthesis protein TsaB
MSIMTTLIAIETSSEVASVALLRHGCVAVLTATGPSTHSHTVLPMIQQLLRNAAIELSQCDAIAFGAGPGSFTGVRTACGIAQGLAFGADRPVLAINTLEAMAQACHDATGATHVVPILDARMGEVYWAQYDFSAGLAIVIPPLLTDPKSVLPRGQVTPCGNGLLAYASEFSGADFAEIRRADLMPHATQIAQLALRALSAGLQVPARDAQPLYLRNQVALTTTERLQKKLQEAA